MEMNILLNLFFTRCQSDKNKIANDVCVRDDNCLYLMCEAIIALKLDIYFNKITQILNE